MNKFILYFIALLFSVDLKAQTVIKNNKVENANRVEVKGGVVTVSHADTVLFTVYVYENKTRLFIDGFTQFKDSSGTIVTIMHFLKSEGTYYNFEITITSELPIIGTDIHIGGGSAGKSLSKDKKTAIFYGTFQSNDGFKVFLGTTNWTKMSIKGIEGAKF